MVHRFSRLLDDNETDSGKGRAIFLILGKRFRQRAPRQARRLSLVYRTEMRDATRKPSRRKMCAGRRVEIRWRTNRVLTTGRLSINSFQRHDRRLREITFDEMSKSRVSRTNLFSLSLSLSLKHCSPTLGWFSKLFPKKVAHWEHAVTCTKS